MAVKVFIVQARETESKSPEPNQVNAKEEWQPRAETASWSKLSSRLTVQGSAKNKVQKQLRLIISTLSFCTLVCMHIHM